MDEYLKLMKNILILNKILVDRGQIVISSREFKLLKNIYEDFSKKKLDLDDLGDVDYRKPLAELTVSMITFKGNLSHSLFKYVSDVIEAFR